MIYKPLEQPSTRLLANKGVIFPIVEKGNIEIITNIKSIKKKVKFKNILQTSEIRSNLISLSKLEDKGAYFKSGRGKLLTKYMDLTQLLLQHIQSIKWSVLISGTNTLYTPM